MHPPGARATGVCNHRLTATVESLTLMTINHQCRSFLSKGQFCGFPMAMVSLTSACNNPNQPQALSFEGNNKNQLRDSASFSSYLNGAEENYVRKLAESTRNLSPIISISSQDELLDHSGGKKVEYGEIGVFGAEKYFNGRIDEEIRRSPITGTRKYHFKRDEHANVVLDPMKPKIWSTSTPSVRSESSWNSQSALLQTALRNPPCAKPNKAHGKRFLASLGCKCSDKKSVDVNEDVGEISFNKNNNYGSFHRKPAENRPVISDLRENCTFTFPTSKLEELEIERKSLEVFGSPLIRKPNIALSLEKSLNMLSWDPNNNDADSDASSDLFEIDSLTGKHTPFLARQPSDGGNSGCATPTSCYAPSEASIEWSVVTASAADFSIMSDCEDRMMPSATRPSRMIPISLNAKANMNKGVPRRRPTALLGCKSHKAVRVVGDALKVNDKVNPSVSDHHLQIHHRPDFFAPVTRLEGETKGVGLISRQVHRPLPTVSRPHSPQIPNILYSQQLDLHQ